MTKTISTQALKNLRSSTRGFLLVDVLPSAQYDADHIPGARNVPLDTADFAAQVALKNSGSKTRRVVVYCAGPTCDASSKAAKALVAGGFSDVHDYKGGLASWNESKRAKLQTTDKPKG